MGIAIGYRFFTRADSAEKPIVQPASKPSLEGFPEMEPTKEAPADLPPLSESNIEYIKTKINRVTKKPLAPAS